ncbi:MAG: hypothetical protein OCD76_00865 [Reichenbachiella sp.]
MRVFLILLALIAVSSACFVSIHDPEKVHYVDGLMLLILFFIHNSRKDKTFVKLYFNAPWLFYFAEYLIMTLVITIALVIYQQWIHLGGFILLIFLLSISSLGKSETKSTIKILLPINLRQYEWVAGMRNFQTIVIGLFLVGLAGPIWVGVIPIVILFLGLTFLSFYEKQEPLSFLLLQEMSVNQLIWDKLKYGVLMGSVFILPLAFMFGLFHPEYWYIVWVQYLIFINMLVYALLLKYPFFEPEGRFFGSPVFYPLGFWIFICPILLPLAWALSIYFYQRVQHNLKFYLNDYSK